MGKATGITTRFKVKKGKGKATTNPIDIICKLFSRTQEPIKNEITSRERGFYLIAIFLFIGSNMYTRGSKSGARSIRSTS